MKNTKHKIIGLLAVFALTFSSCDKDFEAINTDPINILETTADKLLAPALVNTLNLNMVRNRSFNNELMQVTVNISDGDGTVFRYDFRRTQADAPWNGWYVQLNNIRDIRMLASRPETINTSYQGISLICEAWIVSLLTDTYGDVPYTQATTGKDGLLEPAFDKQKDIYQDLFKKLEEANTLLTAGSSIVPSSDPIYKGDIAKWRKFGNSLYLRLLTRVSGKAEVSASSIAKIKEIVEGGTKYPLISNNSESATLPWTGEAGSGPFVNPYVNGIRVQDFRSPGMASFFIEHLRDWNDPRIDFSKYGNEGVNALGINPGSNSFAGVPSGYEIGGTVTKSAYFYSSDQLVSAKAVGARSLQQSSKTGILMNYAELQFILAEAAVKGWIGGSAENYYNTGIANAINYWVPTFPSDPNSKVVKDQILAADIDWNPTNSLDDKMEQIHLQKFFALFLVDNQQWYEYRRTGHPILPKGKGLRNNGVMPARLYYPVYVQSANPTNYKAAVASQGPDEISTNVWWQKP
jgi:hypothetical protein